MSIAASISGERSRPAASIGVDLGAERVESRPEVVEVRQGDRQLCRIEVGETRMEASEQGPCLTCGVRRQLVARSRRGNRRDAARFLTVVQEPLAVGRGHRIGDQLAPRWRWTARMFEDTVPGSGNTERLFRWSTYSSVPARTRTCR